MFSKHHIGFLAMVFAITIAIITTPAIANAVSSNEQFLITVKNIGHKDIAVSLTIDGKTQRFNIDANKKVIGAPTTQIVKFEVNKGDDPAAPTVLPLKLGDEYTACIAFKDSISKSSCLRASLDSLTQPQSKTLDVKFIDRA